MDDDHNAPVRIIKKKGRGHGGHHGGAWKVAYADFVTAMMALFIVLWIVGQSNSVKQSISAYFKDPGVFTSSKYGGVLQGEKKTDPMPPPAVPVDKIAAEMEKLKTEAGIIEKAISKEPDFSKFKDKIQVIVTSEGLRIDLVEDSEGLFFDIGQATIKPKTVQLLKVIASHLATMSNNIAIEGYTDARPYTSPGYSNWNLSTDRANSARKVLEENGIRSNQISEVRGFADRKLKVPDKPLDFSNRRVSILVIPAEQVNKPTQPLGQQSPPAVTKPTVAPPAGQVQK
jgi:chemotaxis protein MotB